MKERKLIMDNYEKLLLKLRDSADLKTRLVCYNMLHKIIDQIKNYPPLSIDQPIYYLYRNWQTNEYYVIQGYISTLRQDKNKNWSFRFSYWLYDLIDITDYMEPPVLDKNKTGKSVHEVNLSELYFDGEYQNQRYFVDFYEARKACYKLNNKPMEININGNK